MWEYYLMGIILIPGLLLATFAEINVQTTFSTYSKLLSRSNITAAELVSRLAHAAGMTNLQITRCGGDLTDHYDSKKKLIALSASTYDSSSVAALGVACHEFGHALQDRDDYVPMRVRQTIIPITNIASQMLMPLVMLGLIFSFATTGGTLLGDIFLWSGIIVFGGAVLVNLMTLPVEFNASKRALKLLSATDVLTEPELKGAKKVLNAAALTYLAALLVSILSLLRFLIIALARRRD